MAQSVTLHSGFRRGGSREEIDGVAARPSTEEIARLGRQIYDARVREHVETAENLGRIVAIDVETGDYALGDDLLAAARLLRKRRPDPPLWGQRIGYDAVYCT